MATKAWIAKQKRREAIVAKYADIRRQLKKDKNFAALAQLPRDSSPTRSHRRCEPVKGGPSQVQGVAHHAP
jgi:small subunit ribosomal protein S14